MPLDFPNSPVLNATYTSGTRTWQWDGVAWGLIASGIVGPQGATLPAGSLVMWAGSASGGSAPAYTSLPTGYLLCDGSNVSRSTYANLFTAIGTRYGSGDGSTTFRLPKLTAEFPYGLAAGASATNDGTVNTGNQSASHTHNINDVGMEMGRTKTTTTESASHTHPIDITTVYFIIKT